MKRTRNILSVVYILALASIISVIIWQSTYSKASVFGYKKGIRNVSQVMLQVDGKEAELTKLPIAIDGLPPRSLVTLNTQVNISSGERLYIKSVFAPTSVYVNDRLVKSIGEERDYPSFMKDPPTIITAISVPTDKPVNVKLVFHSPKERNILSIYNPMIGDEASIFFYELQNSGDSLLFSFVLIILGFFLIIFSITVMRISPSGLSFLYLGLFSLSSGIWTFFGSHISAFLIPYPVFLYSLEYMAMFLLAIPLLKFILLTLNPKIKMPLVFMLSVHKVSVLVSLILHLSGRMNFIKTVYWFQIITPLAFVVITIVIILEHFIHHNPTAKQFIASMMILSIFTILEIINYWMRFKYGVGYRITTFFQLGMLSTSILLTITAGFYVKRSIEMSNEKTLLEHERNMANHQIHLQRQQYLILMEHEENIAAQRHDFRHHLAVLLELNEHGDRDKLTEYMGTLIKKIPTNNKTILCENYMVNAVAVYYYTIALAEGIKTDLRFAIPRELDLLVESDLCIVVGNLLENALEGCMRMKNEERFISLNSSFEYGTLTITVDNSFDGVVDNKDGVFLSSKREGEGIGLASISRFARKYSGGARFETKTGVFCSSIYMCIK